ncbi:MAG: RNA polymerase sigma factor [Oscillospiraceae bacterium]|nr:RNA polymerase sigma factor [Oscillospiraceae bacterium]
MDLATAIDFTPAQDKADIPCLIDTYSTMLYRFCRSLTYSKEDAEDLFQETWIFALRKPQKLQMAKSPQSFLCQTALSLWKSQQRKYARRKRIAPEVPLEFAIDSGENLEEALLRRTETEFVRNLVTQLPEKFRVPLILYYTLEMGVADIAKTLHLPPGTVKSRLFSARQEIKKGLLAYES